MAAAAGNEDESARFFKMNLDLEGSFSLSLSQEEKSILLISSRYSLSVQQYNPTDTIAEFHLDHFSLADQSTLNCKHAEIVAYREQLSAKPPRLGTEAAAPTPALILKAKQSAEGNALQMKSLPLHVLVTDGLLTSLLTFLRCEVKACAEILAFSKSIAEQAVSKRRKIPDFELQRSTVDLEVRRGLQSTYTCIHVTSHARPSLGSKA